MISPLALDVFAVRFVIALPVPFDVTPVTAAIALPLFFDVVADVPLNDASRYFVVALAGVSVTV